MKSTKRSLFTSIVALVLCFSMLLGTTFAWFTDVVTSGNNKIVAGNLKIDLKLLEDKGDSTEWVSIKNSRKPIFNHKNWEPGYTDVKILRIDNEGTLALKWIAKIVALDELSILADVIDVYFYSSSTPITQYPNARKLTELGYEKVGTLREFAESLEQSSSTPLLAGESAYIGIALKMREEADNTYKNISCGEFDIKIFATQYSAESEKDSFDENYDNGAQFPVFKPADVNLGVKTQNGVVTEDAYKKTGSASMKVPTGTKTTKDRLGLTVSEMATSSSNVKLEENEIIRPLDVHVDGVAADNTKAIIITLDEAMMTGLNIGNYKLYHVEDGVSNLMTAVSSLDELDAHNEFYYDPATGNVSLAMATFSEVAVVADTENAWKGNFDYSWYDANATELQIANADQLAAFGAIVGGMAKDENGNFLITYKDSDGDEHHNDTFDGKIVKLLADINLGDEESENNPDIIFYPIGYWNSEGTYEKTGTAISSGFYTFQGTFDGNGNTISNFYQNTWEMKGDHDWYDATLQYFRDGMGLFGRVLGGTIKNLTVDNFSCDSEIGTTGVIAAYADSKDGKPAVFENISITNCNPRVYNIGNGGIVGCAGWYSRNNKLYKEDYTNAVTFKNITVDQTNKISALWGSWGVSCAGILGQYYPNSNCGIKLENCHVAAIIDVNNDVCSNYQYYWYRYAGMFIGTIRANTTDDNGYTVADTTGVTAKDCTYTMGNWNEYWYCEIVANSLASYTHDHQFSRLDKISSLSEIQDENGNWNKEGHFVIPAADNSSATCYHIFRNSAGELYQHFHDVADESNPNIYESFDLNGDGELNDLKEDRQRYFIPFNQLLTGLDMGIKAHTEFEGIKFVENGTVKSEKKFNVTANTEILENARVNIGNLFTASGKGSISSPTVQVYVSPVGYGSTVSATYEGNSADWDKGTLTFSGTGSAKVVITDHFYCTNTTLYVTVGGVVTAYDKFENKFTGDFLYRVGNQNAVSLGSLFAAKDGVTVGDVEVTIKAVNGTSASGTYTSNTTDWTKGSIKFNDTGVVKVTITDNNYCTPTELYLEVVDATNVTGLSGTISGNVVLLNDCGFSSLEVSGGYALYGNGFTMTCTSDGFAKDRTYSFVKLNGGTLDNIRIVVPNFSHAIMYENNKSENNNPTDGDGRYKNIKSAVVVSATSTITNSYISGGRAAIYLTSGKLTVKNSTIYGGAVANIQTEASGHLILEDATLIQEPIKANVNDTSKTVMGLSVVTMCDTSGVGSPITLRGYLHQYAWAHEGYTQYVPSDGQSAVSTVLSKTEFIHSITYSDGVTRDSVNLGFVYMPNGTTATNADNMTDNRTDKLAMPYETTKVSNVATIYTYKNAKGTDDAVKTKPTYTSTAQGVVIPNVSYSETNENRIFSTSYDATTAMWKSTLKVDVDAGAYTFSFAKLLAQKYGKNLSYTIKTADGTVIDNNATITLNSAVSNVYFLTITDNQIYDKNGNLTGETREITYMFELVSTKTSLPAPTWTSTTLNGTPYIVVDSKGGDWNCAVPVLDGLKVKYWSKKQNKEIELDLASVVSAAGLSAGLQNGTNNTITITVADEYTLTITTTGFKTNDNGKPVVVNEKLYFTVASSGNYVSTKTTDRTISISYSFTDANNSESISLSTSFNVVYATYKSKQYKYSDFCNGNLKEASSCVTPDTLVTLADGTQVRVDALTGNEMLLVWNHQTGALESVPVAYIVDHDGVVSEREIVHLNFSNGKTVKMIGEHVFFDATLNKYVAITSENADEFISHKFAAIGADGDALEMVELISINREIKETTVYEVVSYQHLTCFTEGILSTSAYLDPLLNVFDINEDTLAYDAELVQKDIETYGLYTYADFEGLISEEAFELYNAAYLKIAVGKGYITWDDILELIDIYFAADVQPI